jgi:hypothetical protein
MKLKNTVKQRNHYVLFAANSPFKPKTVANKKAYKRSGKHKNNTEA